ncbi:IF2 family translation initiation factor [Mycolicibacterium sp. ELW1]|uniref:IF2 family translation initiation factor n=1 Tax=Mycobacteriaceae TaxID=1762 RepID=UPI0011EF9B14|nr:IF2 family translation initiation factor [Mycobacterium sp. ELW1]QEN12188.1 IF2 family translation initiation factor [Mycobacterium sp. ELW1]
MNVTTLPFAVLRLQYRAARIPLQIVEDHLVARLAAESPARLFYERSLGALDVRVGRTLGDRGLTERGAAMAKRSDTLREAARLDAEAEAEARSAGEEFTTRRDEAIRQSDDAQSAKAEAVEEARLNAQARKRHAAQSAQERADTAKDRADNTAAQRAAAVQKAKQDEQARIDAVQKATTKAADAKLSDAQQKRSEAVATRNDADRVSELADAEKKKRQEARAAGNGTT